MGEFEKRAKNQKYFEWLDKGKPERDTCISKDEIMSLVIDLNNLTVDEFLNKYCSSVRV